MSIFPSKPDGDKYSPTQLLDLCKVDRWEHTDPTATVAQILALIQVEKDPAELVRRLRSILYQVGQVSIGSSLERLHSIATMDGATSGLDGGLDGLDALTYHLSGHHCKNGIKALQAVLKRFEDDERDNRRQSGTTASST